MTGPGTQQNNTNAGRDPENPQDMELMNPIPQPFQVPVSGDPVYNYPQQNVVIPPNNDDIPPLTNDANNQNFQDNQPKFKGKPGFFAACWDASRISNVFRALNLGGFLVSVFFVAFNFEEYAYCLAPLILTFIIYWSDIFCCNSTYKSLKNIEVVPNLHERIEEVKTKGKPVVTFHMECYHYETRYRTVTHTDSKGQTHTTQERYQEKVVTWTGSHNLSISKWSDESEDFAGLTEFFYTRVHFYKRYILHDKHSAESHERQRRAFVNANKSRDSHYTDRETFDITGFFEYALSSLDPELPWFMRKWVYLCFCFFMLELVFSCIISCKTGKKQMTYTKRIIC